MKIYSDIVQQTEAWERLKYGKIGGSRSEGLFVKSDTLFIEMLSEFTEPYEPDFDTFETKDTIRGNEFEPRARYELGQYVGVEFFEAGWLQCDENPMIGISPDGFTEDLKIMCELKCPGAKKHNVNIRTSGIHTDYVLQCVHYFVVNPLLELLYFDSFRPEHLYKPHSIRTINRQSLVNIGTEKTPKMFTVEKCVEMSKASALELKERIDKAINEMKF